MIEILRKLSVLLTRRERLFAALLLALMIVGAGAEAAGVVLIALFVALFNDPAAISSWPYVARFQSWFAAESGQDVVFWGAVGLVGCFLAKNLYLSFLYFVKAKFIYDRQYNISTRLFNSYMAAPYTYHLQRNSAELLRNVKENVEVLTYNIVVSLVTLLMELLTLGFVLAVLLVVEPLVSLVAAVGLGGSSLLFLVLIRKKNRLYGRDEQAQRRAMIQIVNQGFGGYKELTVLGHQQFVVDEFAQSLGRFVRAAKFRKVTSELPHPFIETITVAGLLLIAGVVLAAGNEVSAVIPTLALFGAAAIRLMPSFKAVTKSYAKIRYFKYALDNVYADLSALDSSIPCPPTPQPTSLSELTFDHRLELRNVSFSYPNCAVDAVRDTSVIIRKGSKVAFVGHSGAGKTTIADLILGLIQPQAGFVLVDGRNIHSNLAEWRQLVGYIPQDIFLADASIRANIAFGLPRPEIDDGRVYEAIRAAQLEPFVNTLPDGLDALVGERGVRISGGQRQRIGIARALYRNPPLIIMDEATAALDNQTERGFMAALEELMADRTIVMIAHRLSTVRKCDTIYLLDEGRLSASGSYDDLLNDSVRFRELAHA